MSDKDTNNSNEKPESSTATKWNKHTAGWKPYIEKPLPLEDLDELMVAASIPSLGYYFMLLTSAVIGTFGLISNSAPAIIGAMIIAPLMAPIVSLAYSIDIFDWRLARRSVLTVISGVILVILVSYLCTYLVGLRIAGTEILSRTSPTLLDLGVAMAAGAAAAFSYTRKSIMNSIAGVAIAVALVPPLAVTGIGIAYGHSGHSDVGLSLSELGNYSSGTNIAIGSFILFATNLFGIIFVACLVLLTQGYGQWKKAGVGILIIFVSSLVIIEPLYKSLYKLTVKSKVLSLMVSLPNEYPHMFNGQGRMDAINVHYYGDRLHVEIEGIVPKPELPPEELDEKLNNVLDLFQKNLERDLGTATTIELNLIPVDMLNAHSGGEYLDPIGYKSPEERTREKLDKEQSENKLNN
ncbi:MAG: DUF389 domain-containing protein [Pseudomonadota bacterium]